MVRQFRSFNPHGMCHIMCLVFARLIHIKKMCLQQIGRLGILHDGPFHQKYKTHDGFDDWHFFGFANDELFDHAPIHGTAGWNSVFNHMINVLNHAQQPGSHFQIGINHPTHADAHGNVLTKQAHVWIYYDPNIGCYYFTSIDELRSTMESCFYRNFSQLVYDPLSEFWADFAYIPIPWPEDPFFARDSGNPDHLQFPFTFPENQTYL